MKKLKDGDLLKLRCGQWELKKEQLRCRILRTHCVYNLLEMFQLQSSRQLCLLPGVADNETFLPIRICSKKRTQDRAITVNNDNIGFPSLHEDGRRSRDHRK